ncbi:MAG: cobalt ECF transporter T component CbiQ [Planctomycetaceae bacterium]|nr:cobalt ECF transporter T component CbiQ [Planctomycetaceae bacterium]
MDIWRSREFALPFGSRLNETRYTRNIRNGRVSRLPRSLVFKHPDVPNSPVSRWDARWKLAALTVAAFGTAALTHLATVAVAFGIGLLLLLAARLPGKWVRGRLMLFAIAAMPFLVVLPFTLDPTGLGWDLGPLRLSKHGIVSGTTVFARCLAIGCFALVLIGTAPLHHTLAAANKLKVPGLLVLLTGLAYRYAFLLGDELRRVRVSLRCRGFRMKPNQHGYTTTGHVVGAVLVRGADRADRVTEAMRCRGFDGRFHTTAAFRTTPADIISFVAIVGVMVALLAWDRW